MWKRTQKNSGEERVTAKSRPMMKLIARSSERAPSALSSTASESTWKTRHESQSPLSSQAEKYDRTERPVVCRDTSPERHRPVVYAHSSSYSEWNVDKTWCSQDWKSDEVMEVRTGRLVNEQPPGLFTQHTDRFIVDDDEMDSNTVAESDKSLKSRSFLRRVNDRVRKMQDQSSKDATKDSDKHSLTWGCLCLWHYKHL